MVYFINLIIKFLLTYNLFDLIKFLFIAFLIKLLFNLFKIFIRPRKDLKDIYGKKSWSLVTGATDGIGKAFCFELAKEGFNIILVSRTLSKLNKVSEELKSSYPDINTHCIEYDFYKKNNYKDYQETFGNLYERFDISILVNNVGTDHHDSFEKLSVEDVSQEIILNVSPQAYLTKIYFDNLKYRTFKKEDPLNNAAKKLIPNNLRSGIINISSFVADFPFPMKAVYAATKAFDYYMSIGLENEVKNSNIDFLCVKPLEVATPLTGTEPDGLFIITPEQCAKSSLDDFGWESETYSYWGHKLQAYIINILPRFLVYWFMKNYWYLMVPNPHAKKNN